MRINDNQQKKVVRAELLAHFKEKTFLALADSGTSAILASSKVTSDRSKTSKSCKVQWDTQAGTFITKRQYRLNGVRLPQFTPNRNFSCAVHHFKKAERDTYDLIFCRDLMQEIGLNLLFGLRQFKWGDIRVSMVDKGFYKDKTNKNPSEQKLTRLTCWNRNMSKATCRRSRESRGI